MFSSNGGFFVRRKSDVPSVTGATGVSGAAVYSGGEVGKKKEDEGNKVDKLQRGSNAAEGVPFTTHRIFCF